MKKVVRILSTVLLGVMLTGVGSRLFSCASDPLEHPDLNAQKDQGFRYIVSKDETETTAIILDAAGGKDELVIPEKLGGYRVKQIGYSLPPAIITATEQTWGIYAESFSSIVLNYPVNILECGIINFKGIIHFNNNKIFVDKNGEEHWSSSMFADYYSIVTFKPRGGTLTTYEMFVFYEGTIPKPVDPVKEGATFVGWYKDEELTQEWDFENDIVNGERRGEWSRFIDLYAKWLEN